MNGTIKFYVFYFYIILAGLLIEPNMAMAQLNIQYSPIPASYNITSLNPIQALDIEYDSEDPSQQAFHIYLPDSSGSYPLVIYVHGGGFKGGTRDVVMNTATGRGLVKYFLDQDIAFASIGYRLISTTQNDPDGVKKSLDDSKRALQFIRHHSSELFINPSKIVLSGSSAGAGTSVWLATRDDMANVNAQDPIEHQSTRVCAVEASNSQATYDLYRWETDVFDNFDGNGTNFTIDSIVNTLGFSFYSNFYGGLDSNYHLLATPTLIQYRQYVDMLSHLSSDDPPVYLFSSSTATHPAQDLYHHPLQSKTLFDMALLANLTEVKADIPNLGIDNTNGELGREFLVRHLQTCSLSTTVKSKLLEKDFKVFPNPATSIIRIEPPLGFNATRIRIYSLSGELVFQDQIQQNEIFEVKTSGFKVGLYLVQISTSNGQNMTKKVLID